MSLAILKESNPTARKPHICSLCAGKIEVGETYSRTTYALDRQVYDWLKCKRCAEDRIATWVFDWVSYADDGVSSEDAYEWAAEMVIHGGSEEQSAAKRYLERFNGGNSG